MKAAFLLALIGVGGVTHLIAQTPFQGGATYVVNGQQDKVAPVDTFANLTGPATGPSYGALTYLNAYGIDATSPVGAITITLSAGYTGVEPTVMNIGNTSGGYPNMLFNRPISLKVATGNNFVITTTAAIAANGSLVRFNGSQFFTIDGEGTPGQRNISFRLPTSASATNIKVIDIIPTSTSGVQFIAIKNCEIIGYSSASAINTFAGIFMGNSNATPSPVIRGRNEGISIINNKIIATQNGVYYRGLATTPGNQDNNINISNNIIGDYVNPANPANTAFTGGGANNAGIYLNAVANSIVSGNTIRNALASSSYYRGVFLTNEGGVTGYSLDSNVQVVNNTMYNFDLTTVGGSYGVRISLGAHTVPMKLLVANNSIAGLSSTNAQGSIPSFAYPVGILVEDVSANVGLEVFNNSINLFGATLPPNAVSVCFAAGTGVSGGITMMNNIFSNKMSALSTNTYGYSVYGVVSAGGSYPFYYSSFNNYYVNTIGGGNAFIARGQNSDFTTIKSYLSYSNSDSSSWTVIPPFQNDTILTVANGVHHRLYNRGASLTEFWRFYSSIYNNINFKVNTDIFGNVRNNMGRFTSIGCHLWAGDSTNFNIPLQGNRVYPISGVSSYPTLQNSNGTFKDLADAVNYLNSYGVGGSGTITMQFQTGYTGETGWVPAIIDYPNSNLGTPVLFKTQTGFPVTITVANTLNMNNSALLRMNGCKWVTFNGGNNKEISFVLPALATNLNARVISITPFEVPTVECGIWNCNIVGNSTTSAINTFAGVYIGAPITGSTFATALVPGINSIKIVGNNISAVRNGVYFRGMGASILGEIKRNIIGGTVAPGGTLPTTFIGGAFDQAGIFIKGFSASIIDSNVVRNCIPTSNVSQGFRGIDMDETASPYMENITISRNFLYNLVTTSGTYCVGLRVYLAAPDTIRGIVIQNNFIGRILGNGSGINFTPNTPIGISLDASALMTKSGISIFHNTVNLTGVGLANTNSSSAALFVNSNYRGGVAAVNNIFGNAIVRSAGTGNRYAVLVGYNLNPFSTTGTISNDPINNNNYFAVGAGNNYIGGYNSGSINQANIIDWRAFTSASSPGADGLSFNWYNKFKTDTTPDIDLITAGLSYSSAQFTSLICNDIYGTARFGCPGFNLSPAPSARCIGAVEFGQTFPSLIGGATYQINGIQNPPLFSNPTSGSFSTIRNAIAYLNSQGVDGSFGATSSIKLVISAGYIGEKDTFIDPITVLDYPRQNPKRPIILTLASGRNDTIIYNGVLTPAAVGNQSVIRFAGARYFTIDGSNNQTTTRNMTLMLPASFNQTNNRLVDIIPGANPVATPDPATTDITIKNCNLVGISTTSSIQSFAGVYLGGMAAPSNALFGYNNNINVSNNFIGAVQNGVYLRGNNVRGKQDVGTIITKNDIGGNFAPSGSVATNYFGGATNSAGIYLVAQAGGQVTDNIIKNNIITFGAPRGIELGAVLGSNTVLDSAMQIIRNKIYNIRSSVAGGAYGIYINYANDNDNLFRNNIIANNMISGISSPGNAVASAFIQNPYGIAVDAQANMVQGLMNDIGLKLYYNTINLGSGNTLTTTNSASAALGVVSQIRGGIVSMNNIFQNKLGRLAGNGSTYAVLCAGTVNPFTISDNNDYFAGAPAPSTNNHWGTAASTTVQLLNQWNEILNFTGGDTLSFTYSTPFLSDTNLFVPSGSNTAIYQSAKPISGYTNDILGNPRNTFAPTVGAHEYDNGTYADSIAPRIFNMTDISQCIGGPIVLNFRIYDKQQNKDTLYYKVNGGAVVALQAITSNGVNRTYMIPAQTGSALVEFRISARDYPTPPNIGVYPTNKAWDTVSTNINVYPYFNGFEGANSPIWLVQSLSGNAQWELGTFGSSTNPFLGSYGGLKTAMFRASTMSAGASSRLVSPCFDLTNMTSPTLRFYVSQNSDLLNKRDSIAIKVSSGGNFWTNALKGVIRPNFNYNFPGWALVEVCLAEYAGLNGLKIGFEAYASGAGNNIMIDDITVFDDVQMQTFTPKVFSQCFRDSITVNITGSDNRFRYTAIDKNTGSVLSIMDGTGNNLPLRFLPPTKDSLSFYVLASNKISASVGTGFGGGTIVCKNNMPDELLALINRYYNGPFVVAGAPYNGAFNAGSGLDPDAGRIGDTITYRINPPGNLLNSDYGTKWTITSIAGLTGTGTPLTNLVFTPPAGNNAGFARMIAQANQFDSLYFIKFSFRLNPTSCDSVITRALKIAASPLAGFVHTPADTMCQLANINFQALNPGDYLQQGPFTYLWIWGDNSTGNVVNPTKVYSTSGTFDVRLIVTNRFGLSNTFNKLINVRPAPNVSYTYTTPCSGDSTVFTPPTQLPGATFLWTFPGNKTSTSEIGKFNFPKFDTTYQVKLRIAYPTGCANSSTSNIYVFAKPTAVFTVAPHCLGSDVPLTNTSSIQSGTFGNYWSWGNGQNGLGATPTYKYPLSGNYTVKLRTTSAFGCSDSLTRILTVYDKPVANFTWTNACREDVIALTNSSTYSGGATNVDYLWNFGDNTQMIGYTPNKVYNSVGTYNVSLLSVDKINMCRDSITKSVSVSYKPVAQFTTPQGSCVGSEVPFINSSYTIGSEPFTCYWTFGDASFEILCNTTHTYSTANNFNIKLIVHSTNGNCYDTAEQVINVGNAPAISFTRPPINTTVFIWGNQRKFSPSDKNGISYKWEFGDPNNTQSSQLEPVFTYNTKGTYTVKLTMNDSNGCVTVKTDTVMIYASVGLQESLADKFKLSAYPNPFSSTTNVDFTLDKSANVRMVVSDILGREIKATDLGNLNAGAHKFTIDEGNFNSSSATYIIKLEIGDISVHKTIIRQQ